MTSPEAGLAPSRAYDAIMLDVGDGHWIYVEQVGDPGGVPALFLHGGPGSGAQHFQRSLFDLESNRAILFDQRGAGRSHPYLGRAHNTTGHLIADIERIREHLGIARWIVTGGSWGSTLAIAYAEAHPERVAGLVLRAVFLGTAREVQWAFVDGPRAFRPELYAAFVAALPASERADPLQSYLRRLNHADVAVHAPAAHVWNAYERALSVLEPGRVVLPGLVPSQSRLPPTPLMEAHYIAHDFFLADGQLLDEAPRLAGIPGTIVQGRYDLLCPPAAAHALAARWPECRLSIIDRAGHAMTEPGVMEALRIAIAAMTARF